MQVPSIQGSKRSRVEITLVSMYNKATRIKINAVYCVNTECYKLQFVMVFHEESHELCLTCRENCLIQQCCQVHSRERHKTKPPSLARKNVEYFKRLRAIIAKQNKLMILCAIIPDKAQEAFFLVHIKLTYPTC